MGFGIGGPGDQRWRTRPFYLTTSVPACVHRSLWFGRPLAGPWAHTPFTGSRPPPPLFTYVRGALLIFLLKDFFHSLFLAFSYSFQPFFVAPIPGLSASAPLARRREQTFDARASRAQDLGSVCFFMENGVAGRQDKTKRVPWGFSLVFTRLLSEQPGLL